MTKETFASLEAYMAASMGDSAHDKEHIYRVLYNALAIAKGEPDVDYDILIAACLLHDIGRKEQLADPSVCHAAVGAEKACVYLTQQGFPEDFAQQVRHCILTHRFRKALPPQTIEAKILFDADKLDVTGALGIARTLVYKGATTAPLYTRRPDGSICDGTVNQETSFFREYKFKLENLYDRFYTQSGARMAQDRKAIAAAFYEALYQEVTQGDTAGKETLSQLLKSN